MSCSFRAVLIASLLPLWACSTIQDRVCTPDADCEQVRSDCTSPDHEIARAVVDHQVDWAHYRAETEGEQAARQIRRQQDQEGQDAVRSPEELAYEPIDPSLPEAALAVADEEKRQAFEETHGVDLSDEPRLYRSHFESSSRSTIAVHRPGDAIELYGEGELQASLPLNDYDDVPIPDEIAQFSMGAIDLVRGDTTQLKLVHAERHDDGEITYHVAVYKLIGDKIGTIFRKPIASQHNGDDLRRLADLRFLHGVDHRIIEWIPLEENGEPSGDPQRYRWNRWEGVYRIPMPPPTAPADHQS